MLKTMKKIISVSLSLLFILSYNMTAFAAESDSVYIYAGSATGCGTLRLERWYASASLTSNTECYLDIDGYVIADDGTHYLLDGADETISVYSSYNSPYSELSYAYCLFTVAHDTETSRDSITLSF